MTAELNNAKALYMEGILDGNAREAVEKYTGDCYTQHSPGTVHRSPRSTSSALKTG